MGGSWCEGFRLAGWLDFVKCMLLVRSDAHVILIGRVIDVQSWAGVGFGLWPFGVFCGVVQNEAVFGRILYLVCGAVFGVYSVCKLVRCDVCIWLGCWVAVFRLYPCAHAGV